MKAFVYVTCDGDSLREIFQSLFGIHILRYQVSGLKGKITPIGHVPFGLLSLCVSQEALYSLSHVLC